MKQRIKEELQIVTATRRLHLDEQQELQRMEREMEERLKERKLRAEQEERELQQKKNELEAKQRAEDMRQQQQKADAARRKLTQPSATLTARVTSPQASPRRGRHKRQNSDPIVAKFSPIEEDRDIEADIQVQYLLQVKNIFNFSFPFSIMWVTQSIYKNLHTGKSKILTAVDKL